MKTIKLTQLLLLGITIFLLFNCSNNKDSEETISLWPEIEPYQTGYLKVSDIHEIYYELCGNPEGKPVFVIHGGPGSSSSPYMRRFFNPDKYLIVLHDQRGCGKSRPNAEIRENTTQFLVQDIEKLRKELSINKIILFGGSWGSTLSLAYAETYPENVNAMVLRGIFLATAEEDNYFPNDVMKYHPELREYVMNSIPDTVFPSFSRILQLIQSDNITDRQKYAEVFSRFEYKPCGLNIKDEELDQYYDLEENENEIYTNMLLEYYYFQNHCFLEENQLLNNAHKIQDIPVIIINGRYDIVCPPITAYKLSKMLSKAKLKITEETGHLMSEKNNEAELVKAMIEFE